MSRDEPLTARGLGLVDPTPELAAPHRHPITIDEVHASTQAAHQKRGKNEMAAVMWKSLSSIMYDVVQRTSKMGCPDVALTV